jgi:hypothetical protein
MRSTRGSARARIGAALAALLALGAACGPPPPVEPDAFVSTALAPAAARADSLESFLASGRVEAEVGGRRGRGRLRVVAVAPHRLRVDLELSGAFGLFGARAVLWAGPEGMVWQEGNEPPRPVEADALFAPVLGRGVGVRDLELILFGLAALRDRWPGAPAVRRDGRVYALEAGLPGGETERAAVGGDPPVLRRLTRRSADGKVVMAARFDRHRGVGGLPVAARIEVRAPVEGNWLRIDWRRLERDWPGAAEALAWPVVAGGP